MKEGGDARPIANQPAGHGEIAPRIDPRNGMAGCQRNYLLGPAVEERIGEDEERSGVQLGEQREGGVDLIFDDGFQDRELQPLCARRFLQVSREALGSRGPGSAAGRSPGSPAPARQSAQAASASIRIGRD
jgi:hypothetical protein